MNDVTGFSLVDLDRASLSDALAFDMLRAKYGVSAVDASKFLTAVAVSKAVATKELETIRGKYDVSMSDFNWYSGLRFKPKDPPVVTPPLQGIVPTKIKIVRTTLAVEPGGSAKFGVYVEPEDADKSVYWSTRDESVATINETGLLTGVSVGETKIEVVSKLDSEVRRSCFVRVVNEVIHASSIRIEPRSVTLHVGEEFQLELTVDPPNATPQAVLWFSAEDVATVERGKVTAVGPGVTTVRAISDGRVDEITVLV